MKTKSDTEEIKTFFFSEISNEAKEEKNVRLAIPGLKDKMKHNFYKIYSN